MNARVKIILGSLLILPLVGCEDGERNRTIFQQADSGPNQQQGSRFGYNPGNTRPNQSEPRRDETTNPTRDPADDLPVDPLVDGGAPGTGTSPGTPGPVGPEMGPDPQPGVGGPNGTGTAPAPASVPFAEQVPGMSGYVWSPFAPGKKVEVIGYPPGTKVKCPYTGKEFKVP